MLTEFFSPIELQFAVFFLLGNDVSIITNPNYSWIFKYAFNLDYVFENTDY